MDKSEVLNSSLLTEVEDSRLGGQLKEGFLEEDEPEVDSLLEEEALVMIVDAHAEEFSIGEASIVSIKATFIAFNCTYSTVK